MATLVIVVSDQEFVVSLLIVIAFLAGFAGLILSTVICVQKGKTWMAVCGWLLMVPVVGVGAILLVAGAVRIAKPDSRWALRRYADDPFKQQLAKVRFPKEALRQSYAGTG